MRNFLPVPSLVALLKLPQKKALKYLSVAIVLFQVLSAMGSKDFSLEAWDTLVKVDLEHYKNPENIDPTLNPDEEAFLNYYNVKNA
jgi:hypothetical protein